MGKRQDNELDAIRLYADGNEIPAIADELGVSENSLRKWKKRAGTEWDDARKAARQSQIANIEDVGSRIRRAREIATQITGNAKDQGELGLLLNQGLQTMVFDLMGQIQTVGLDADDIGPLTKLLNNLSLALGRTEQAASRNQKTALEIRKQAFQDAATEVEKQADTMQIKPETLDFIKKVIYGLA